MSSKSETGHATNVANLDLLNTHIISVGSIYQPNNPVLLLPAMQSMYTTASKDQDLVNKLLPPYSFAVDARALIFKPINKNLTKLRKAYKATRDVVQEHVEGLMTIIRKIKGDRPGKNATSPDQEQNQHSTSQLSYDQRTNSMGILIAHLQNTPHYNPNEEEYKVATYQATLQSMLSSTKAVADTFVPLNKARSQRNHTLYNSENNLVDTANLAKDYLYTILDANSAEYKAISKIKFRHAKK